jgi:single-strand DNA-binding protein
MYQQIVVVGRLGRDAEIRVMPSGEYVLSFPLASERTFNDKSGQRQKETSWFRVQIFGKAAESLIDYLTKGTSVLVEGRLRIDPSTGGPNVFKKNDGTFASSYEIVAGTIRLLGGGNRDAKQGNSNLNKETNENDYIPF